MAISEPPVTKGVSAIGVCQTAWLIRRAGCGDNGGAILSFIPYYLGAMISKTRCRRHVPFWMVTLLSRHLAEASHYPPSTLNNQSAG